MAVTIDDLIQFMQENFENCIQLAIGRGDQYATQEDTLKTFRSGAKRLNVTPSYFCLTLIVVKMERFMMNVNNNVDYTDSMLDLIIYLNFYDILKKEETK